MASLKQLLPPPAKSSTTTPFYDHTSDPWFHNCFNPPYLKPQEFGHGCGDGGAFPEIHVAQFPLGMGMNGSKILSSKVASRIIYSQYMDLVPKILKRDEEDESHELQKEIEETTEATKAALEKIINIKNNNNLPKQSSNDSKFIKYNPSSSSSQQSAPFNSGAKERIIRMVEMTVDPLEPPKFKHKKIPRTSDSPPVTVLHSPPRSLTVKNQQEWMKIPPCISNWKNPKGYTIPLDKRLASDGGRRLEDVQINDNFAKISEALYVAEQKAREAVAMRLKVQKEMALKEKEKKELQWRALAAKARSERRTITGIDIDGARLKVKDGVLGKKRKIMKDKYRDVSEKVALGIASVKGSRITGEVVYDERLFNQEKGMNSGFVTDDQYNVYDKGLFTKQSTLSGLYQPKKDDIDSEMYGGVDEQLDKIRKNTDKFKPDKGFTGIAEKSGSSVRFEQADEEADDPFGLADFMSEVHKG